MRPEDSRTITLCVEAVVHQVSISQATRSSRPAAEPAFAGVLSILPSVRPNEQHDPVGVLRRKRRGDAGAQA